MTTQLSPIAAAYVRTINDVDPTAFMALFADSALVNDNGRDIRGRDAIKAWSDREIFEAQVRLEVLDGADGDGESVITTKVDGNFDRTGLPDPVVIDHRITTDGRSITGLTCRLANQ